MTRHRTHTQTTGPINSSTTRHVRPSIAQAPRLDKRQKTPNPALHTAHKSAAQGAQLTMPARTTTARHTGRQRPPTPTVVPRDTNHHGHTQQPKKQPLAQDRSPTTYRLDGPDHEADAQQRHTPKLRRAHPQTDMTTKKVKAKKRGTSNSTQKINGERESVCQSQGPHRC